MSEQLSRKEWFKAILAHHEQRLVRFSRRITGNHESARDVVQEAFLRLWKLEDEVPVNTAAWLFQVCRNRALDVLRRNKKMVHMTVDEISRVGGVTQSEPESHSGPKGLGSKILEELNDLPENQQEVIRLKFQEGLSYREISEVTGLSMSNVGYLIHNGIKNLRAAMTSSEKTSNKNTEKKRGGAK